MTIEKEKGRQDDALEACNAEAAAHKAGEQLNVFDKGRMEGPDADSTTHGTVRAVCVSKRKGTRKTVVDGPVTIEAHHGVAEDAHAGDWHRQVSLLAWESIEKARARGLDVKEGDFAENITTEGINLMALPLGTQLKIGDDVLLELSQQGKVCHKKCAIFYLAGDCIFPREGIFFVALTMRVHAAGGLGRAGEHAALKPRSANRRAGTYPRADPPASQPIRTHADARPRRARRLRRLRPCASIHPHNATGPEMKSISGPFIRSSA